MNDVLDGVDLGRQVSRATCWASSVAAIGRMACPEITTNAAALVVAEGITPDLRADDAEACAAYEAAKNANAKAEQLILANAKPKKETRDPSDMLWKHFKVQTLDTFFTPNSSEGELREAIIGNIGRKIPLILGLSPTRPLTLKENVQAPTTFMHTLVCYGIEDTQGDDPVLRCQDPAAPPGSSRDVKLLLSQLVGGYLYITKEQRGPKFLAEYTDENVSLKLVRLIQTFPPSSKDPVPQLSLVHLR